MDEVELSFYHSISAEVRTIARVATRPLVYSGFILGLFVVVSLALAIVGAMQSMIYNGANSWATTKAVESAISLLGTSSDRRREEFKNQHHPHDVHSGAIVPVGQSLGEELAEAPMERGASDDTRSIHNIHDEAQFANAMSS